MAVIMKLHGGSLKIRHKGVTVKPQLLQQKHAQPVLGSKMPLKTCQTWIEVSLSGNHNSPSPSILSQYPVVTGCHMRPDVDVGQPCPQRSSVQTASHMSGSPLLDTSSFECPLLQYRHWYLNGEDNSLLVILLDR